MSRPPLLFRPSAEPPADSDPPLAGALTLSEITPDGAGHNPALTDSFPSELDSLAAFEPESELRYKTQRRPPVGGPGALVTLLAVGVIAGILGLTYMALRRPAAEPEEATSPPSPAAADTGQALFDSRPSGADVIIDGIVRGKTPLKLSLPVGSHTLEITGEAGSRSLPLTIDAGMLVSQSVEFVATPDHATGRLEISSEPSGAQVKLDGVAKGVTPLSLDAIESRDHSVSLTRGTLTVYRTVKVAPGATASVFASLGGAPAAPGTLGGFISLKTPFEVQVFEAGQLLGTTSTDRLMVPTGRHQLDLVASAFDFRTSVTVEIEPGKVASPAIAIPNGSLSVNALPWAEVFVDGRSVGTTPLGNLQVPIGSHEVTWRHPQLGERRQTVPVTATAPARASVDFGQ